jgi:hypothetical protein
MKKNCLALLICGLLCTQAAYSGAGCDERAYVHNLTTEIEDMFEFFRDNVVKLIDATDHTPYRVLVTTMSVKLDNFESRVVMVLAKKLVEVKANNPSIFQQALVVVHEILSEFMAKVKVLRNIMMQEKYLNTCEGGKSLDLCKELKQCKEIFDGSMVAQLDEKLEKLYRLVSSKGGDQELADRIKQTKTCVKSLKGGSSKKSGYELKIVNGIAAKLRHNRPARA